MSGNFVGLFTSKVAVAAMGGLLLAGGVSTVAFAAPGQSAAPTALFSSMHSATNHGHENHQGNNQGHVNSKGHKPTDHSETVAIHGTLTQPTQQSQPGAAPSSILVTGQAEDNDDHGGRDSHDTDGANGSTPACTLTSPYTINVDQNTKVNGLAKSLSDLSNPAFDGHKVEVKATETPGTNGSTTCTLLATKVTVSADRPQSQSHHYAGTVGSVGASSFTLDPKHGAPLTVNVTPTTTFGGHVHQLSDLTPGMHVEVRGTDPSGNTVQASRVDAHGHNHLH